MPYKHFSAEEVESQGEAIYQTHLRQTVEPGNLGKFVVIDIETGAYEVDDDDARATQRMLEKRPDAVLYGLRIGCPTAYTLGGFIASNEP